MYPTAVIAASCFPPHLGILGSVFACPGCAQPGLYARMFYMQATLRQAPPAHLDVQVLGVRPYRETFAWGEQTRGVGCVPGCRVLSSWLCRLLCNRGS